MQIAIEPVKSQCSEVVMNAGYILNKAFDKLMGRPPIPRVRFGPPRRIMIDTSTVFDGIFLKRGSPILLRRRSSPQWFEKGWQRLNNSYQGYYRVADRGWKGLIKEPYRGGYEAFIWNPPLRELERNTEHKPCFMQPRLDGRYRVHFREMPVSIDHAIKSIEDVLREAYRIRI